MLYSISRPSFDSFVQVLGKPQAEAFVSEFEQMVNNQRAETQKALELAQAQLKITTKDELRNELVTRELFEERFKAVDERFKGLDERFKVVDEKFKRQDFKLNVLIALALVALTFANPTFVELLKHVLR